MQKQPCLIQDVVEGPSMQYAGSESIIQALQRVSFTMYTQSSNQGHRQRRVQGGSNEPHF